MLNPQLVDFEQLPWGKELCDIFVILNVSHKNSDEIDLFAKHLVFVNCDWIEVLGQSAETYHDRIDSMSVSIGRQSAVGNGSPMTAWHEELCSTESMAGHIASGGHGYTDNKLVVVIGTDGDMKRLIEKMKKENLS